MGTCAFHRFFFLLTAALWMFVTMYILREGTGPKKNEVRKSEESYKVMEELERQNIQLKEIAEKMRVVETRRVQRLINENVKQKDLLGILQTQLNECEEKSRQLAAEIETLKLKKQNTRTPSPTGNLLTKGNDSLQGLARSSYNQIVELWYSIRSKIMKIKEDTSLPNHLIKNINYAMEDIRVQKSAALIEVELMQEFIGEIETKEMRELGELVQKRFHYLQNPKDCKNAKTLVCNVNKGCGFGCQLHHVTYCFLIAIGLQRTLVLNSKNWRYSDEGWESVFQPLSKTCTSISEDKWPTPWSFGLNDEAQSISLSVVDSLKGRIVPFLPLNVPSDIASKLKQFHGQPIVWWIGQVVSYLVRPQPWLIDSISQLEKFIGFKHPVAGIHVRRTDKVGTEAQYHSIHEYMVHVVDWFDKENMKRQRQNKPSINEKLVYVASDDPNAIEEAKESYPDFKFLADSEISKNAGTSFRYSQNGLRGVISDILLLSKCDYMVGTFSSQVSRAAFELMQTNHPDASAHAHSLDDVYYFGGQGVHSKRVIYDHNPMPGSVDELKLKAGDLVGIAGNHWDGFSKGPNQKTNIMGLYPSYKVIDIITDAEFPTYPGSEKISLNETKKFK